MAKMTLIEIANDIANDIDTEPFNSIDDTIESVQIAQIVKTTFFEIIANRNWPHLKRTVQLDSVADFTRPTHLKLPLLTKELLRLAYNRVKVESPDRDNFKDLYWVDPEEFLKHSNMLKSDEEYVEKINDFGGAPFYIRRDKQPECYTSFDDEYVILDSYLLDIENTVQTSNTQALVYFEPSWVHSDDSIPDLPSEAFPLLLEEAKSAAFLVLRQQANAKSEQRARRQNTWLARKSWRVSGSIRYPDYGRK